MYGCWRITSFSIADAKPGVVGRVTELAYRTFYCPITRVVHYPAFRNARFPNALGKNLAESSLLAFSMPEKASEIVRSNSSPSCKL